MELAIIIGILFGIGSALIANSRGANAHLWFMIGFLVGPFGLLFALLLCGQQCPHCKSRIHQDATVCPKCQKPVERGATT